MEVLDTVEFDWETIPQYMDRLDQNLGVNVGNLIGHSAVRYYVMGDDCQKRDATEDEIEGDAGGRARRHRGRRARTVGVAQQGHYDPQGVHIPALWATEDEIFALGDVLRDIGTGVYSRAAAAMPK